MGIPFFLMGALFFVIFARVTTLECRRPEPREIICERRSELVGAVQMRRETIRGLSGAWVDESCDDGCTYRVVLTTERGDVPLTNAYTSEQRKKIEIAEEVNLFVDSERTSFEIEDRPSILVLALPIIFMIVGPAMALINFFR
jgi:hypothetical protein